mgnify:CR=1 FL=1
MKAKKILSVLLTSALCGAMFAGCNESSSTADTGNSTPDSGSSSAAESAESKSSSKDLIRVGIINNDPNESGYRTANDNDLKATFNEANGYDAQFAYSLKNDEQISYAQKFIQDEVDYLLLSAADTAGWDSVLKDAKDAGVKVILFDRTIDAAKDAKDAKSIADGIKMINKGLVKMLEDKYGLVAYGSEGDDFDPEIHEAIGRMEDEKAKKETLAQVYLKGYKLKDRAIRLAKVMVKVPKTN